jgi:hypothetical protein
VVVGTEEAIIEAVHRPSRRVTGLEAALATGELG